jgi:hypothetical protein
VYKYGQIGSQQSTAENSFLKVQWNTDGHQHPIQS